MMNDLFEQILEEKDRIILASLLGGSQDYSKLRELCGQMNAVSDTEFAVDGSEKELWRSVLEFYRQFLK